MVNRGVLAKNYYIDPEAVAALGADIERVMTEADQAMEEASEIIAGIASLTERVPEKIRCSELLELCETAQAEIKSFDFLSYGKRVNQGLLNLIDHNQYITENFIRKMRANTERAKRIGEEFRKLTDMITYSGGSVPTKGTAFSAVDNAEIEDTDGGDENASIHGTEDLPRAGAAEALEAGIEEVMKQIEIINRNNERYNNNLEYGKIMLQNYMKTHGIGDEGEIDAFIDWLADRRPGLLAELYVMDAKNSRDVGSVYDRISDYYDIYRAEQGAVVLNDFLRENSGNITDVWKPELIVPYLWFFYPGKLIDLCEIESEPEIENNCKELIDFYADNVNKTHSSKTFYAYTWLQINSINSFTHDDDLKFNTIVEDFVSAYETNKEVYSEIAKETGIPPEVIAVIHYREASEDCIHGIFGVDLRNGDKLDGVDNMSDEDRIECFISTAETVINHQVEEGHNRFVRYNPSANSDDIVAMVCFTEVYNGTGYYDYGHISPYSFSGTDVYVSGKFTSDGHYDEDTIDQQVGTYRLLLAIVAGIYDVENGKNYVNEICGGYIQ